MDTSAILLALVADGLPVESVADTNGTINGLDFDPQPGQTLTPEQIAQARQIAEQVIAEQD